MALVWANRGGRRRTSLRDFEIGPEALHLHLTLGTWAADGLLALFFFVAGLELKREFVAGDLRDPRRAALPVAAAVGGMVVPALIYVALNLGNDGAAVAGPSPPRPTSRSRWRCWPSSAPTCRGLRTFLLTLAVVDDLLAITVIALFYTEDLTWSTCSSPWCRSRLRGARPATDVAALLLLPLALVAWVSSTLRGARDRGRRGARVHRAGAAGTAHEGRGLAERLEHLVRPLSAGFAVPVFAFFAAGVTIGGSAGSRRPCRTRWRSASSPAWSSARPSGSRLDVAARHVHPRRAGRRACRGSTWSGWRCSRASASPCRC